LVHSKTAATPIGTVRTTFVRSSHAAAGHDACTYANGRSSIMPCRYFCASWPRLIVRSSGNVWLMKNPMQYASSNRRVSAGVWPCLMSARNHAVTDAPTASQTVAPRVAPMVSATISLNATVRSGTHVCVNSIAALNTKQHAIVRSAAAPRRLRPARSVPSAANIRYPSGTNKSTLVTKSVRESIDTGPESTLENCDQARSIGRG